MWPFGDDFTTAWQGQKGCGNEGFYEECKLCGVLGGVDKDMVF